MRLAKDRWFGLVVIMSLAQGINMMRMFSHSKQCHPHSLSDTGSGCQNITILQVMSLYLVISAQNVAMMH